MLPNLKKYVTHNQYIKYLKIFQLMSINHLWFSSIPFFGILKWLLTNIWHPNLINWEIQNIELLDVFDRKYNWNHLTLYRVG